MVGNSFLLFLGKLYIIWKEDNLWFPTDSSLNLSLHHYNQRTAI